MTPVQRSIERLENWWRERVGYKTPTFAPLPQFFLMLRSTLAFLLLLQIVSGILLSLYYQPSAQPLYDHAGHPLVQVFIPHQTTDADGDTIFSGGEYRLIPFNRQRQEVVLYDSLYPSATTWELPTRRDSVVYVPSSAWLSTEHTIMQERASGSIIRGVHSLCAHLCIAIGLLYILVGVAFGIYRAPREAVWMSSVLLLLVFFASAWSGSVLPWNQRSYASLAVVLSSIEEYLPLVGKQLASFLRSGENVSTATLPRVYIVHLLICPLLLVGLYYFQHRKEGKLQTPQLLRVALFALMGIVILFGVYTLPQGDNRLAYDYAQSALYSTSIKPEWYFLDAYYALREFSGDTAALLIGFPLLLYLFFPFVEQRFRAKRIVQVLLWLLTAMLFAFLLQGIMM